MKVFLVPLKLVEVIDSFTAHGWQQFENFSAELMLNDCTRCALSCDICNEHDLTEESEPNSSTCSIVVSYATCEVTQTRFWLNRGTHPLLSTPSRTPSIFCKAALYHWHFQNFLRPPHYSFAHCSALKRPIKTILSRNEA